MARTVLIDCEGLESEKKSMLDHSKSMRFGAVHSRGADVFFLILLWVEKNGFRNWFAHGDQTAAVSVSVSFYADDGFQPMQKELYNNNDKKTE